MREFLVGKKAAKLMIAFLRRKQKENKEKAEKKQEVSMSDEEDEVKKGEYSASLQLIKHGQNRLNTPQRYSLSKMAHEILGDNPEKMLGPEERKDFKSRLEESLKEGERA